MIQWSPQTRIDPNNRGYYKYEDHELYGFSLTHLSGVGCPALGDVPILPWPGDFPAASAGSLEALSTPLQHTNASGQALESALPGKYAVQLPSGISVDLTVTLRAGIGRFQFPNATKKTFLVKVGASVLDGPGRGNDHSSVEIIGQDLVVGSVSSGGFCSLPSNHTVYFAMRTEFPFQEFGTWDETGVQPQMRLAQARRAGAYITFAQNQNSIVQVKVGISYVSIANALLNLNAEITDWNYPAIESAARTRWTSALGSVRTTGGTLDEASQFYTSLYHMLLSPNIFQDANGDYIGFDGNVRNLGTADHYANFSDWDTYRNTIQLQAFLFPAETSAMMNSLVRDGQQMGWLPKWPLANYATGDLGGDSPAILLSTAYAFGARSFDTQSALALMLQGATVSGVGPNGYQQRPDGDSFRQFGYVPAEVHPHSASHTLEYSTADFAIAQFAAALGDTSSCTALLASAQNWQHLFDPAAGWIRPRLQNGVFSTDYSGQGEQFGFEEGSTWQYSWMVPHNYAGLFQAMGGSSIAFQKLEGFFANLHGSPTDPYYNPGNEPNFVSPYAFLFAGSPWRTQELVPAILKSGFSKSPSGLPGNDDMGAMSGVFLWGAIGIYPAIPGVGGWVIGVPHFSRITIRMGNGHTLDIQKSGPGQFVQSLRVNGADYPSSWLPVSLFQSDLSVEFTMGPSPNLNWASQPSQVPPSFGTTASCTQPGTP